jgi:hypothetical protein
MSQWERYPENTCGHDSVLYRDPEDPSGGSISRNQNLLRLATLLRGWNPCCSGMRVIVIRAMRSLFFNVPGVSHGPCCRAFRPCGFSLLPQFMRTILRLTILLSLAAILLTAQSADDKKNELSGAFRYEIALGSTSFRIPSAPGWGILYDYRVRPWLALGAGLDQIPRPVGMYYGSGGILFNAKDELYLVPFGVRTEWKPAPRLRLSVGGGGAYFRHTSEPYASGSPNPWGWQVTVSARTALSHSGRFWIGATARYYYVRFDPYSVGRVMTIGPDFTWSF